VPSLKEIRRRITSVKNTRQITRAMKLVSAAKLKRAQDAALAGRLFSLEIQRALLTAIENLPEGYTHPYLNFSTKPRTKRRIVVVGGERGLCGAFNANVTKAVQLTETASGIDRTYVLVGRKAVASGKRFNWNCTHSFEGLGEDITAWPIENMVSAAVEGFEKREIEEVALYYTQFVSAMTQRTTVEQLLPLDPAQMRERLAAEGVWSPIAKLDPSPKEVFEYLAPLYIRARLREAALESKASEHAARMTAMDSATNNASDLIDRLRLYYNRARQSAITRELIDIIGGASAVE